MVVMKMSQRAHRPIPLSIGEQYTEENIKSTKRILWKRQRVFHQIINEHPSNAIKYTVMACIDPKHWETIKSETTLDANNSILLDNNDIQKLNSPLAYIKIQVKSAVSGNAGKVSAYISGTS